MFERRSMDQILDRMIGWTRGVTGKLTDFRVGSKTRTLYESVALVQEDFEDRVFRSQRKLIEENIYAIIGFDRIPASYASGIVKFSRTAPADRDYLIPAGTILKSLASEFKAPRKYRTTEDAVLETGAISTDVTVLCEEPGEVGNIEANTLTEFIVKPTGIDAVTNPTAFANGEEEETKEAQKARFQQFVEAQARGVLQSVQYGGSLAKVLDPVTGMVQERVIQAVAVEELPARRGEVDLFIWNGIGEASEELVEAVRKIQHGYYDELGNPVYGYKPAGIQINIHSAPMHPVRIKLYLEAELWASLAAMKVEAEAEIDRYFAGLKLGDTLIQTALESKIEYISGVRDVKVWLSTDDGATYNTDNVVGGATEIIVAQKPIEYM